MQRNTYTPHNTPYSVQAGGMSEQAQRVLRNTYALLALSMVPTLIGATVGVQFGFSFFAGCSGSRGFSFLLS